MTQRVLVCEYVSGGGLAGTACHAELLAQGLAMRDAMLADLARLRGVQPSCVQAPGVPASASGRAVAPRPGESLLDVVRREAACHERVWVVAPESEGCLAAMAEAVAPRQWIGCSAAAIRLAGSKRATLARLAAHGVATPLAFARAAERWVVKPDDGAGAVDSRVHAAREAAEADLASRAARGADATLEPWVEGEALSLSLLVCGGGADAVANAGASASACAGAGDHPGAGAGAAASASAELLSVNRQHIEVAAGGVLAYRGVDILALGTGDARHAALRAIAQAVARAVPGLRGFVGIDLVWHPSRGPVVIEINPRLTCAYADLSAALGRNLAGELLALHDEAAHAGA